MSGYGNYVKLKTNEGFEVFYGHLKGFNSKKGSAVKKGDVIAFSGNTGMSTGPHLHYQISINGTLKDPMEVVSMKYTKEVEKEYSDRKQTLPQPEV